MDLIVFLLNEDSQKEILPTVKKICESSGTFNNLVLKCQLIVYRNFDEIKTFLDNYCSKFNFTTKTLIFLSTPTISHTNINLLRNEFAVISCFGDISQHYLDFYRYSQFLYDGLIIYEPEYKGFFDVYGTKTFDGTFLNHDIGWVIDLENFEINSAELHKRKYDFSFVGRFDRSKREKTLIALSKFFPNTFILDSSKKKLTFEEMREIIINSKFFLNLTGVPIGDSFGINNFPDSELLQRKSRVLSYGAAGCICFTESLPQSKYYLNKNTYLPLIEIPRNKKSEEFCFEYINTNFDCLEEKSKLFREKIYQEFSMVKIHNYMEYIVKNIWEFKRNNTSKIDLIQNNLISKKHYHFLNTMQAKKFIIYLKLLIQGKERLSKNFFKKRFVHQILITLDYLFKKFSKNLFHKKL